MSPASAKKRRRCSVSGRRAGLWKARSRGYARRLLRRRRTGARIRCLFQEYVRSLRRELRSAAAAAGLSGTRTTLRVLAEILGPPQCALDVLDAGCGTGLCAPLLKPYARSLAGVDLSGGMLAKALSRAIYDQLVESEISRLLDERAAQFDVIASADTLCYFGDLASVVQAARTALRPQGWLAFTLERADDVDAYRIQSARPLQSRTRVRDGDPGGCALRARVHRVRVVAARARKARRLGRARASARPADRWCRRREKTRMASGWLTL